VIVDLSEIKGLYFTANNSWLQEIEIYSAW
jgi:hypothetical protein